MSQEQKPNQAVELKTDGPVDIDQLEVDILIICKNTSQFQQTATFLSRRGWPTTVMNNLSKAIDYIVKNKPDFVMISCNHPSPGVAKLPNLLGQMKTTCIGFSEVGDAASNAKLASLAIKHKLQGLASGPNVQRMIRKVLMDIYNPTLEKSSEDHGEMTISQDKTIIAGSSKTSGSNMVSIKGQSLDGKQTDQQIVGESNEESIDAGNYRMGRQKERKKLKDIQSRNAVADGDSENQQLDSQALLALAQESEKVSADENRSVMQEGHGSAEKHSQMQHGHGNANKHSQMQPGHGSADKLSEMQEGHGNAELQSAIQEGLSVPQSSSELQSGHAGQDKLKSAQEGSFAQPNTVTQVEKSAAPNTTVLNQTEKSENSLPAASKQAKVTAIKFFAPQKVDSQSSQSQELFEKAVSMAFGRVCQPEGQMVELKMTDSVGIVPVDSTDLHGYLVLSLTKNMAQEPLQFLSEFRKELNRLITEYGLKMQTEEGFVVVQEPFPFLDWSKQEADLSLTAQHKSNEIGISFLQTEERISKLKGVETDDMAKISVSEIITDQPVTFKAYLHFKQSDRFYLYLRNGRKLYKKQKERLLKNQVSDFYIKSVDIKNYQTYSAANFIAQSLRRIKPPRAS